jgi:hypothetical protein
MTIQRLVCRKGRLLWLPAAVLAVVVLLTSGDVAQAASATTRPDLGEARDPVRVVAQQCCSERIPLYVNPSRRVLYPGEQVLLSVGDDWLKATLTWDGSWVSGNLAPAGWLSTSRGPYVTYTAPYGAGDVNIVVSGSLYGRTGLGVATFSIQP